MQEFEKAFEGLLEQEGLGFRVCMQAAWRGYATRCALRRERSVAAAAAAAVSSFAAAATDLQRKIRGMQQRRSLLNPKP